ncbi:hypothetical protein V2A60_007139 [Cordyceps javanica]|uniref:LrgB-like protein n=1 Tax=Cordyceps javanica TaxID=43265 RepID=A0A545VRG0_9HYPO|nr:LrgB-like protein [Cordyceps javanica]TQW04313.1 LrgB-like protein [Cordyceps javanica]
MMQSRLPSLQQRRQSPDQNPGLQVGNSHIDMETNSWFLPQDRRRMLLHGLYGILLISVIYLLSQLLIWGLSLALSPVKLEFLSSVLGMLLVFVTMMILSAIFPMLSEAYEKFLKQAVDFINRHMGAAFAIPMVMLNGDHSLDTRTIGVVVGVFIANSLVMWTAVFALAILTGILIKRVVELFNRCSKASLGAGSVEKTVSHSTDCSSLTLQQSISSHRSDSTELSETASRPFSVWIWICQFWPLFVSSSIMISVGVPLAVVLGEPRIIDGCALWFIWIACMTVQRASKKRSNRQKKLSRVVPIVATLANPVMFTILFMTAYIRLKAYFTSTALSDVLYKLSSGTQLYKMWNYAVDLDHTSVQPWFGAGDAALSMLGCGFIVWGFKLYECRRQLFSASGATTILVSIAVAAGNVFLGAHTSSLMGLERPEALSFAARMTTLALAIPAMKNVGGNASLTVALMITNGVLGQLMYPSSLNGTEKQTSQLTRKASLHSCSSAETAVESATSSQRLQKDLVDSAETVAAGIAIGINGAAMGVAYLYENKSRSAPYATLAMTAYSVATVFFIAVHPFRDVLLGLV